jgi:hypothetical protein
VTLAKGVNWIELRSTGKDAIELDRVELSCEDGP